MVDASIVASAAKWIASALSDEGRYLYGVKDLVRDLQISLEGVQEILQRVDANPDLVKEDGQLRILAKKIRDLAFRAEDVTDTYIVDVGEKIHLKSSFFKYVYFMSHSYSIHMFKREMKAIQRGVQDAKMRFEAFGTNIRSSSRPVLAENWIYNDDEAVVGIDDIISELAKRLTDPDDDFRVLGIVGVGGSGKSTLATQLFHHPEVEGVFPHRAYAFVSRQWSRIDILRHLYKELKGERNDIPSNESALVKEVHDFMNDRPCLVVLEDIWKKEAWDDIYPILPPSNKAGCRVIVTTRIEEIPLLVDTKCIIHEPRLLTENQKWTLFSKVAMEGQPHVEKNIDVYEKLGRQMLAKFQGLPLEIVTLAGVLRTKQDPDEWEAIAKACSESMLELGYLDMPYYLKLCFLYLAMFQEDCDIEAHWLVRMWIAEGFITNDLASKKGDARLEDVGMWLINELAQRCIIQVTSKNARGQIVKFRLQGLMRELCLEKAEENQVVGPISTKYRDERKQNRPRRTSVHLRNKFPIKNRSLRTIFDFSKFADEVMMGRLDHLGRCKLLRVLMVLCGDFPKYIGKLVHLRFLAILDTTIRELPESIQNLRNLLYFRYVCGKEDVAVPNDLFYKMKNLRELALPSYLKRGGSKFFNNNFGLSVCKDLQSLNSGAGTWMVKEVPTLSPTLQNLAIVDIQTPEEIEAIYQCPSIKEDRMCTLSCDMYKEGLVFDIRKIRHCKSLWSLELYKCPLVFGDFPPNLVKLCLSNTKVEERKYDDLIEVLGELSSLKTLSLFNAYNGKRLNCNASSFPQLQELEMEYLFGLEEWMMEEGAMPRLTKLRINFCRKLNCLPLSIRSIASLKTLEATYMREEFCKRLGYGGGSSVGEDQYIIQHIPSIKISFY